MHGYLDTLVNINCRVHWNEMSAMDPPGRMDGASWVKAGDTENVRG